MATEYTGEVLPFTEYTGDVVQEQPSALSQIGEGAMKYLVRPSNELAGAIVEPILQMGTGFIAKPVSEIAGLAATGADIATGGENAQYIPGFQKEVADSLTYQPRTQAGQSMLNPLVSVPAAIGGAIEYGAGKVGEATTGVTGSEIAGAGMKEAATQATGFLGVKGAPKVGSTIEATNQVRIKALQEQKAFDAERNRIRDEGKKLGLLSPAESGVKRTITGLGQANKFQSLKNRETATKVFAEEVGINKKGSINDADISNRVSELTASYGAVEKALGKGVPIKLDFKKDVNEILAPLKAEYEKDPITFKDNASLITLLEQQLAPVKDASGKMVKQEVPVELVMAKIKRYREQARNINKRKDATLADEKLAETSYELANLYENLMERELAKSGKTALLEKFRDSRKKLAQIHVLESVRMDDGLIDPRRLSSVIGKYKSDKKYATGKIKTLAEFANTFDKVMAPITKADLPTVSKWELAAAAAGGASGLGGNLAGLSLAIPAAARTASPMLAERGLLQGVTPSYELGAGRSSLGLISPAMKYTPFIANQPEEQQ